MINIKKLTRTGIALLCLGALNSCEAPNDNVAAGDASFGALASQHMADYYYPKQSGKKYIYKSTITNYDSDGDPINSYVGGYDTLRTLGYQGFTSPEGDSVFAFSVTYRVASERNNKDRFQLYMVRKTSGKSAFIAGNNPAGFSNLDSISSVTSAIDTILYAVEGPARDVIDNPNSNSKSYRTDKIFFTANNDEVLIWWHENGVTRETRLVWNEDFAKNNDWLYAGAVGDPYTYWEVRDPNKNITVTAGSFRTAKIEASTEGFSTSANEFKWWGHKTGLVKQQDEWKVTTDGVNFRKKSKVRELISIN